MNQTSFPFVAALPSIAAFEAHKRKYPHVKPALVKAAFQLRQAFGVCLDIHAVYSLACKTGGIACSRDYLPAYAREIEAEHGHEGIIFNTRSSRYDA